jgi:hypothetical protein
MKKSAALFWAALALASPGMAFAASPDGNHTFTGTVQVKKDIPVWTSCTMTAVVNVSGGVPKLQSAALAGAGFCPAITFTGLPGILPLDFSAYPSVVIAPDVGMNFPGFASFPPGVCFGDLKFLWDGTAHTITFLTPLSDLPGSPPPPCKIQGSLLQTSGSLNLP